MKPGLGGKGVIRTSVGRGVSVGTIWEEEDAATDGGEGAVDMAGGVLLAMGGGGIYLGCDMSLLVRGSTVHSVGCVEGKHWWCLDTTDVGTCNICM